MHKIYTKINSNKNENQKNLLTHITNLLRYVLFTVWHDFKAIYNWHIDNDEL